jgi:hypothetical protein
MWVTGHTHVTRLHAPIRECDVTRHLQEPSILCPRSLVRSNSTARFHVNALCSDKPPRPPTSHLRPHQQYANPKLSTFSPHVNNYVGPHRKLCEEHGATTQFIDLGKLNLPLYDQDVESKGTPPGAQQLKDAIRGCDGLIICTPECACDPLPPPPPPRLPHMSTINPFQCILLAPQAWFPSEHTLGGIGTRASTCQRQYCLGGPRDGLLGHAFPPPPTPCMWPTPTLTII